VHGSVLSFFFCVCGLLCCLNTRTSLAMYWLCSDCDGALSPEQINALQAAVRRRPLPMYVDMKPSLLDDSLGEFCRSQRFIQLLKCVISPCNPSIRGDLTTLLRCVRSHRYNRSPTVVNQMVSTSTPFPFNPKKYQGQRGPKKMRLGSITQLLQGKHKGTNQQAEFARQMYEQEVEDARERVVTRSPWMPEFETIEDMKEALETQGSVVLRGVVPVCAWLVLSHKQLRCRRGVQSQRRDHLACVSWCILTSL